MLSACIHLSLSLDFESISIPLLFGAVFALLLQFFTQSLAADLNGGPFFKKLHAQETNGQYIPKVMRAPAALAKKAASQMAVDKMPYRVRPQDQLWSILIRPIYRDPF